MRYIPAYNFNDIPKITNIHDQNHDHISFLNLWRVSSKLVFTAVKFLALLVNHFITKLKSILLWSWKVFCPIYMWFKISDWKCILLYIILIMKSWIRKFTLHISKREVYIDCSTFWHDVKSKLALRIPFSKVDLWRHHVRLPKCNLYSVNCTPEE